MAEQPTPTYATTFEMALREWCTHTDGWMVASDLWISVAGFMYLYTQKIDPDPVINQQINELITFPLWLIDIDNDSERLVHGVYANGEFIDCDGNTINVNDKTVMQPVNGLPYAELEKWQTIQADYKLFLWLDEKTYYDEKDWNREAREAWRYEFKDSYKETLEEIYGIAAGGSDEEVEVELDQLERHIGYDYEFYTPLSQSGEEWILAIQDIYSNIGCSLVKWNQWNNVSIVPYDCKGLLPGALDQWTAFTVYGIDTRTARHITDCEKLFAFVATL